MESKNDRLYKKIGRFIKTFTIGSFVLLFCLAIINFFPYVIAIVAIACFIVLFGHGLELLYTSEEGVDIRNRIKTFFHDLIRGHKNENQ